MPTARTLRLNELLQRELSSVLRREYQTEAVAVTITAVQVSPDLHDARVFVAVTGDETLAADRFRWLRREAGALRHTLARAIALKHFPALTFVADTATPRGNRILALLDEIAAKEKASASAADADVGGVSSLSAVASAKAEPRSETAASATGGGAPSPRLSAP